MKRRFKKDTVLTLDMINGTVEINPEATSNQNTALLNENAELRRLLQQSGISIPKCLS